MDEVTTQCPYCYEVVTLEIDPDTTGTFIEDCEVCCRPWQVTVRRDAEGNVSVQVQRGQ